MRWYSTVESTQKPPYGDITVLAIIETIVATSASIGIALYYNTWTHIATSSLIAPFILLRTPYSTKLGINIFDHYIRKILGNRDIFSSFSVEDAFFEQYQKKRFLPFFILNFIIRYVFTLFVIPVIIRFASILIGVVQHPIDSIKSIPANWVRSVLAIDVMHASDLLPGFDLPKIPPDEPAPLFDFPDALKEKINAYYAPYGREDIKRKYYKFMNVFVSGFVYFPSLVYRFSLKSTALVYIPFVLIAKSAFSEKLTLRQILQDIKEDEYEKFMRRLSLFTLLVIYIVPFIVQQKLRIFLESIFGRYIDLFTLYIPAYKIEIWQVFTLINILLTLFLFFFADRYIRRMDFYKSVNSNTIENTVRIIIFVRKIIGLYTIACTLYIIFQTIHLPEIGTRVFPF